MTKRLSSLDRQFHCSLCHKGIAGDNETAHLRSAHPEVFAAQMKAIEEAAARFRASKEA